MSAIPTHLNEILKLTRNLSAQNMRSLAVFDLDSTLFNVSTRTQKILDEYADLHGLTHLKTVQVRQEDWGLKDAFQRSGYNSESDEALLKNIRNFWSDRFFSNEYLHYDVPYLGAVTFVQELADTGCEVCYLTGRDVSRMAKGSLEVLNKWGFPADEKNLFLKPDKSIDDELFKHDWFKKLNYSQYAKIFFFENEPVNVNAILAGCPEVEVIFLDTTHSRQQEVNTPVKKIKNYHRN